MNSRLQYTLEQWQQWCSARPDAIVEIEGGLTNQSFKVDAGGERFVVRLNHPQSERLGINRLRELQIQQSAARAGIATPIVYSSPEQEISITRWIEGRQWQESDFNHPQQREKLIALVKRIRELPATPAPIYLSCHIEFYWQQIAIDHPLRRQLADQHHWLATALREEEAAQPPLSICHHDLLCANIIEQSNGNLTVLDWEYAALGHANYEVAVMTSAEGITQASKDWLWHTLTHASASQRTLYELSYQHIATLWETIRGQMV